MAETLTCNPKDCITYLPTEVSSVSLEPSCAGNQAKGVAQAAPGAAEARPCERATHQLVTGRQSNHGDWTLPPEMAGTGIRSLWLAVAFWSLRQARPVTRDDIAQAFRISVRRAADVVSYLLTTRADRVACERKIHRVASGHRVATLRVLAGVAGPAEDGPGAPPPRPRKPCAQERDAREQAAADLARAKALFLGRRTGPGAA
ncbi:CaiF/GrlA family transcriptional regulator [Serratia ureilytica]|uniref:CaiF/GrlA family transcriptional regulator n=1 Tax=Serratia ureilytica TaxID=300181 RepID=UPI0018D909E0|nr:CaiF/GrlA family transcriptional regulator [Serratia ureilytica]MBH2928792.1 CaiF/GrlA family transcriptional regulator [Serratia ureilytica]